MTTRRGPGPHDAGRPVTDHPVPAARGAATGWSRPREAALLVAGGGAAAAAIAAVHVVDPNEPGHFPGCPFLALTGLYCPGCGSTRALAALSHLDVGTALARNPLAVVAMAALLGWYVVSWWRVLAGRPRRSVVSARTLYAVLMLVLGYWVARNVPGWTWLSPA